MIKSKTGIVYDAQMLNHKSRRKHPESPARVETIMKMLQEKYYLTHPKVDYRNSIQRFATDE